VRLTCPPASFSAAITADGELAPPPPGCTADTTISLTPGLLLRVAARDENAWRDAQVSGDVELAAAIDYVRRNLAWDYEESLSRVFGDVAAHRLASTARSLDRWGRATLLNLAQSAVEYATYESPVLAGPGEIERFSRDVDTLRDDAARLEKRVASIARRLGGDAR
jgi:ubiquinone biosynthesis protein UbiJ